MLKNQQPKKRSDTSIANSDKQFTIFLDPSSYKGKQTLAYAKSNNIPLREVDIIKSPLTGTQIVEIADLLNIPIKELVNKGSQNFTQKMKDTEEFDEKDWVKILEENPDLIRAPIVLKGQKAMLISTPTDVLRF